MQKGKSFIGNKLYKVFGNADFRVGNLKLNLCIHSLIDQYILLTGQYDSRIINEINISLAKGGIFIDIGANIGYYSVVAAKLPNVRVLAFEPSPHETKRLLHNVQINGLENVKLYPTALSNRTGTAILNLFGVDNPGKNSLLVDESSITKAIIVPCNRLDTLIEKSVMQQVNLIKIDVEGLEYEVLQGMEDIVCNFKGKFIVEMNYTMTSIGAVNPDQIYQWMAARNFKDKSGLPRKGQYDEIFVY